ncbi:polysaccharide biosynthesis tyrosine autokinase [Stutzerimonas tarimensis]|uniref:Polysaccharide biosynthesis tyrosine autokinase n=1 Tax=Stutzerimonas tarimensis TaxID=1507735 RepID=A0ABV7T3C0_9GAMM
MTVMTRSSLEYNEDSRIDLAGILRAAFDHKVLITSITLLFMALGVAYALMATPIYRASAMIQIEPKKNGLNGVPETVARASSVSLATAEIELIKSRAVLGQTVENLKLHLVAEPRHFPLIGGWLARMHDPADEGDLAEPPLGLSRYAWGGERLEVFQLEVPDDFLGERLTLVAGQDGAFEVFDQHGDLILQGRPREAIERNGFKLQVADLKARPGTEFRLIRARPQTTALLYQKRLKIGEAGKDSGVVLLAIEDPDPHRANAILDEIGQLYVRQNIERTSAEATQRLDFLRSQVPVLRKELEKAEAALNAYQTSARSVDISIETKSVLDQIVTIESSISDLNLKRVEYDRLYTPENPIYKTLMKQIGELNAQREALMRQVDTLPMTQQELLRLKRDMEVTTQTYTLLLNKAQEQDIIRAGTIGNVRIIDHAYSIIEKPAKPIRSLVVLIAMLLGVLVSALVILLRQAFYRGIEAPDAIENLGLPVYAALPLSRRQERLNRKRSAAPGPRLLAFAEPDDLAVESLRSLRTSLRFAMIEARNKVVMITSPTPGVGKSFVSANLAAVVAQAGQKVLLIDGDMRRGYLHGLLQLPNEAGLSDALAAGLELADVVQHGLEPNLDFIGRGGLAPNPSELLMREHFTRLLQQADDRYDLIIIDTPPVLAVTDAVVIAQQSGTSLLAARFGRNSPSQMEAARNRLAQNGVVVRGAVLNAVKRKASNSAYDTGAYGYYSYPSKA